jgi:hypothetical protein
MKLLLKASLLVITLPLWAETIPLSNDSSQSSSVTVDSVDTKSHTLHTVKFNLNKLDAKSHSTYSEFKVLSEKNISFSQTVGESRLPFKSVVVAGSPDDIEVTIDPKRSLEFSLVSSPAQPEDCRCETDKKKSWVPLKKNLQSSLYKVEFLGKFRGQDLSRVTFYAAKTNLKNRSTIFYPELEAQIKSRQSLKALYTNKQNSEYDYLIVTPEALLSGLSDFVQYKMDHGLKVKVITLEEVGNTVSTITDYFKNEYQAAQYKYALIVGTDTLFPNHNVVTSGSSRTPSDYPYFLMDDQDMIPDVQYGRIVASTSQEVERQTKKWMNYQDHGSISSHYIKMIGIASNEGENPSDDEYVTGIEKDLSKGFGTVSTHFYQNDATSRPRFINEAFNKGTGYLVYLGHGSGTSWASTGSYYTNSHVAQMNNANVLQPVIIDVACQNGILKKGFLGETFMNAVNTDGNAIGAAMYYGGSVNISWHPPAIMARGMVKQVIAQKLTTIGDALLSGHLYLMENYTDIESVRDNFEWYHLFGDPSSAVYFN